MENKKNILIVLALLIAILSFVIFNLQNEDNRDKIAAGSDFYKEMTSLPKAQLAREELIKGNNNKAQELYLAAMDETNSQEVKSVIAVTIANIELQIDKQKAVEYYKKAADDELYPKITRGFALLQISQYAAGEGDIKLLRPFFQDDSYTSLPKDLIDFKVFSTIYNMYPFGIAAAELAIIELSSPTATGTRAYDIKKKYDLVIDKDIDTLRKYEGMKSLVPMTFMAKAKMYEALYNKNAASKEEVLEKYNLADKESALAGNNIAKQFNLLDTANFLATIKENDNAKLLFTSFINSNVEPMIDRNLKTRKLLAYKALLEMIKSSKDNSILEKMKTNEWYE